MALAFHTSRIDYTGPDRLDISRKSGCRLGVCFAPSWNLLKPYIDKRGAGTLTEEDWQRYRRRFLEEMRQSYARQRRAWDEVLGRNHVVLLCYCRDPGRCHRGLVAWVLLQLGAEYLGELNKDGTKPEHIAVVGSRPPSDKAPPEEHAEWARIVPAVTEIVRSLPKGSVMVSGGARGVDDIAEHAIVAVSEDRASVRRIILPAPWDQRGRQAGPIRNGWVSRVADRAIAIPSSWGSGTQHLVKLMEGASKPVEIVKP